MGKLQCDICGGRIVVLAGGQRGECEVCGAGYGIERLSELASGAGGADVPREDPERKFFEIEYGTLVKYHGVSKNVRIPDDVVKIKDDAFSRNKHIEAVTIPDSVAEIGDCAFLECGSLTSVNIPDSVTEIGSGAFSGCQALTTVNIPNSVVKIGNFAFEGCGSLTSVTIPKSVIGIDYFAFDGCRNLATVNIANPMCMVMDDAFRGTLFGKRREEKTKTWRARGRCQHCGGPFRGLFSKKTCSQCGRPKDY